LKDLKKPSPKQYDDFLEFLDKVYLQNVVTQTDWLSIQIASAADLLKVPIKDFPEMARQVRRIFTEQVDKLTRQAFE